MFIIEVQTTGPWTPERGDYFVHDGAAITEAKRRQKGDGIARRVVTWPAPQREVWPKQDEPPIKGAA
jgi:hypothetical protein